MRLSSRVETRRTATRSILANKRRRIELLRNLQRSGEEVTVTTLSSAFELTSEAKDLFLIGGQIGHYFREYFRGKGEIDAFLIAALEPENTSAFVYSQKAPRQPWHQWLAAVASMPRHLRHEEATFISLSRKQNREAKDLLLIGSQIGLYFRKYFEEKGEIKAFLMAALGQEPTSQAAAATSSQRQQRHPWWAPRYRSQHIAQPVRDPQADAEASSELTTDVASSPQRDMAQQAKPCYTLSI